MSFSLFGGLEAAKRALLSQQYNLTNIGHNIANVNTPGYSRQQVLFEATRPYQDVTGSYGTGVSIATVRHIRDAFLTAQYRTESQSQGHWNAMDRTMSQVENVFLEPSDNALNDLLDNFFDAWQGLTTAADSQTARSTLREEAVLLINGLREAARRLTDVINNLDDDVGASVSEINEWAVQISTLNQQIAVSELDGNSANDLRDRRDNLIDELSTMVKVHVIEEPSGATRLFIGALEYVGKGHYRSLSTIRESAGDRSAQQIVWEGTQTRLSHFGGKLGALIEARDEVLPQYIENLDTLVATLVQQVNALHTTGFGMNDQTGVNFFDPTGLTAATIDLSQEVKTDASNICASSAAASPGNNEIALAIAGLKSTLILDNGSSTFNEYYSSLVGLIGANANQAAELKASFDLVLEQLEYSRQSVQGVSLDEEMANLIRAQHAYDAAARVIVTIDNALGTIVNELGVGAR